MLQILQMILQKNLQIIKRFNYFALQEHSLFALSLFSALFPTFDCFNFSL